MSLSESTKPKSASLTRDVLSAARYYLGGRRALLIAAVAIAVSGLALNWNWLVAVGLVPILLSTLPCLVMCAFGVCMMCRSDKENAISREASSQGASLLPSDIDASQPAVACCHQAGRDAAPLDSPRSSNNAAESSRIDQQADQRHV